MSIDLSGASSKLKSAVVTVSVDEDHKLIKLANALPLEEMVDLVTEDLKKTTASGCFHLGRKLVVRVHLMIYLLQKIFDYTDRQVVALVKENAVYQHFCGSSVVEKWSIPVHQKVADFRNRLSTDTQ